MNKLAVVLALCMLAGCATVHKQDAKAKAGTAPAKTAAVASADAKAAPAAEKKADGNSESNDAVLSSLDKEYGGNAAAAGKIADPLKPWNLIWYHFNDKLYQWLLRPVAIAYGKVIPSPVRLGVDHFFENLKTPVKATSCLMQARWEDAGRVMERFGVNTTAGGLGFYDFADKVLHVEDRHEDVDQALGRWGMGPVCYIVWPFVGPCSLRGTVGMLADGALSPESWVPYSRYISPGTRTLNTINGTSLDPDFYLDMKKGATDPYVSIREAYAENREKLVKE